VEIEFPRPTVDDPYAAERSERGFLDYTDSRHLEWAYVTTQTIQEAAEQFEACYDTVRYQMVQEEIHCPEKQGEPSD
jgi:hypothetical protein